MKFKKLIIDTLSEIPEYEFNSLKYFIDLRTWYNVKINGEMMEWWACDDEINEIKSRHENDDIEFIEIPLIKTIMH